MNYYSCSSWNESGPERVHQIYISSPGTITATLTNISVDLDCLHDSEDESTRRDWRIRERKASGALFKEGRENRISAVHVYEGKGRD